MNLIQVQVEGANVSVEHDRHSTITIYGEPIDASIDYDPEQRARGLEGKDAMDILQSIDMMDFEANIAMLLRGDLKIQQLPVPLSPGKYSIEIDVTSRRDTSKIPLIDVIKSVIDGVNKEIIGNDVTIYEANITYTKSKNYAKNYPSKPEDTLSVRLYSMDASAKNLVVGFDNVPIHVVPKVKPQLLDDEQQSIWWIYNEELQKEVATALSKDGMQIPSSRPKRVDMTFTDNLVTKADIDNMARVYYQILRKLGVSDDDVHTIHLIKQLQGSTQQSNICIVVQ